MDLDGRRALVTGGASGIGRGTARRLVEHGASVVVGDVDEDGGRSVAVELGVEFVPLDVADPAAWHRVVWPGVDVAPYEWNPALPVSEVAT